MQLGKAPKQYDEGDEANLRGILEREDKRNLKQGNVFDKFLMRDTVTGVVKTVTIASGAFVIS